MYILKGMVQWKEDSEAIRNGVIIDRAKNLGKQMRLRSRAQEFGSEEEKKKKTFVKLEGTM